MVGEREKVYVTYIYPFQFVVHDENEKLDFSIDKINSLSYDHSLLHRIIGTISNQFDGKEIEYIICGDGALGIKEDKTLNKDELLVYYNDFLCKLFLGGLNVEAITNKDITSGSIFESKSIWPVSFGKSLNSHIHAELRMKLVGITDAIILFQPENRTITIRKMEEALNKGSIIVASIPNLSTFHLINGITEFRNHSWSSALTYLWIVIEEMTDYLWIHNIIEKIVGENIKKRKEMLKDSRIYTMSVKQEMLLQIGILNDKIYNKLFEIRQIRNKLVHEGKMVSQDKAKITYEAVIEMLTLASKMDLSFLF